MATANIGRAYIQIVPSLNDFQNKVQSELKKSGQSGGNAFKEGFTSGTVAIGTFLGNVATKAFDAVANGLRNSVSGAIQRVDELNKFAPSLSNIGVAADDADAAINKMSERLVGLPTTLDDAASSVKLFTSANGDVGKSTDYFLALNDALIAGNAPLERQSEAVRQMSEAYSRGKPDMKEWRILMETMPGQLNQVAEAMGYGSNNAQALGEDLRKGEVSMDDFMQAMVKLDQEGADGLKSLEEQARTASGSIQTSQQVMQAAISRGVGGVITALQGEDKAINKAMESSGKVIEGILSGNADKMKAGAEGLTAAIESFGQTAPEKIKQIIQSLSTFISTYFPTIFPVLVESVVNIALAIVEALPELVKVIVDQIPMIINTLVENLLNAETIKTLVLAAIEIVLAIVEALPDIIQALIDALPIIIDTIVSVLLDPEVIEKLLEAGIKLIIGLAKGIIAAVPQILIAIGQIVTSILGAIVNLVSQLPEMGKRLIEGLWNGINDAVSWITEKIKGFCNSVLDAIKGFFGIHSPSTVFRDQIGRNIGLGVAEGIEDSTQAAVTAVDDMASEVLEEATKVNSDIANAMSPTFGTVGTESNQISRNIQQYNVFNQVADGLDVIEASRQLGFAVEIAI